MKREKPDMLALPHEPETPTTFRDLLGHPIPHTPAPAPCPFCGSDEWVFINVEGPAVGIEHGEVPQFCVECVECGTEGPIATTTRQAARLWNRRPSKPVGFTRRPPSQ